MDRTTLERAERVLTRVGDLVEKISEYMGVILLVLVGLFAAFQVFVRFFGQTLGYSAAWTEELARYSLVSMTFIGIIYTMRNDEDISIRPMLKRLPVRYQYPLLILTNSAIIVFCGVIIWSAVVAVPRTINVSLSITRWLTVGYVQILLAISAGITALLAVEKSIHQWREFQESKQRGASSEEMA